jgi:uridine phosphorylase
MKSQEIPKWPAALMVFRDKAGSGQVLDQLDGVEPIPHRMIYNSCGPELLDGCVYKARIGGDEVLVLTRCVWGGPQVAILVEELACLGVRCIVGYGIAGSMDPALRRGNLIVGASALASDGTTRAYSREETILPDGSLLEQAMRLGGQDPLTCVRVATVDALYRETHELIDGYKARGAGVVNMETSPLYAVTKACGIRAIWLGYVSDLLLDGRWDDWYVPTGEAASKVVGVCEGLLGYATTVASDGNDSSQ